MKRVRFRFEGEVFEGTVRKDGFLSEGRRFDPETVDILPPCNPSKTIWVGMNHREHVEEINEEPFQKPDFPAFFFKPPSAVIGHQSSIKPHESVDFLDYEGEMAVIIGEECNDVLEDEAMEYVDGVTCANDVSARDWLASERQWARGKGQDTFAPLGPFVQTNANFPLTLETRVNGEVRQHANTSEFLFDIPELIAAASRFFTLHPGDVIVTGTPAGTAAETVPLSEWGEKTSDLALFPGDTVEVELESVGVLENPVK